MAKAELMKQAGIPEKDWGHVDYVISKESSWNPNAINPSSGACGLGQQLPCGKWPNQWNDPVGGLKDAHNYAQNRYGGWQNAANAWAQQKWW